MDAADDPVPAPARLRGLASRLLNQAALQGERLVGEGLSAIGARKWHYAVLAALADGGPGSQAALSRRSGLYRSDLVAVINELAENGYVERRPDPDDRRRNVVTVTDAGRDRLGQLDRVVAGLNDQLLAPLSAGERDQLIALLTRLVDHHRPAHPAPPVAPPAGPGPRR